MQKFNFIFFFFIVSVVLFLCNSIILFFFDMKFFFISYFKNNEYGFLNILFEFLKYNFSLFLQECHTLLIFFYKLFQISIDCFLFLFIKLKLFFKSIFIKIELKKQSLIMKHLYKAKGLSEYFGIFFSKPTLYRFFSFYITFLWLFINLDWSEHFVEAPDKTTGAGEFETDFEEAFSWEEDPLIGRNFFFTGQRLSFGRTSEQPDLYKSNDFFFQPKKSKFTVFNREFLGGPIYLNVIDLFSLHEVFNQLGTYEFFGSAFITMNVSYEIDFEFDFSFLEKFKIFFKHILRSIYKNFLTFQNSTFIFKKIIDNFLYIVSFFFLLFKYIYKFILKK